MLGSLIVMPLAALAMQGASDTTRVSREAYTACLRTFVTRSLESRMTLDAFNAAFPTQCQPQQTAFREAVIRRETASRVARAAAEESAGLEIEDAQVNFRERFEMMQPESAAPAATATPAPAATPAPTPAPAPETPAAAPPPPPQ